VLEEHEVGGHTKSSGFFSGYLGGGRRSLWDPFYFAVLADLAADTPHIPSARSVQ